MQLELIEKLADENLAEVSVARLIADGQPRLVTVRRLSRQLTSTPGVLERLKQASQEAAAVTHPQLLSHLGMFEAGGYHYWLSERTEGFDLNIIFGRLASREVRITPLRTLQIGVDTLAGLVALHEAGLFHGGLAPAYVVVDLLGMARLDGFGLEQTLLSTRELKQKVRRGRKEHLAPEVAQGRPANAVSDVFSSTALIYHLLTGISPLGDQKQGMSTRHQAVQPPSKMDRSLPFSCDAVFVKALAIAPRSRHESAASLRNAMVRLRKSLLSGADEGRAGVSEFMASLYPNEALVAGMPGTIDRPSIGEPIILSGQDITLRSTPPAAEPPPGKFASAETKPATALPALGAEANPGGPARTAETAAQKDPPESEDLGFPEQAEPLDGPDVPSPAVEPEQAAAVDTQVLQADQLETIRVDPVPDLALDDDEPATEEYRLGQGGDTSVMPVPKAHDTEELPQATAGSADLNQGEPAPDELVTLPPALPSAGREEEPSAVPAYRKPPFIIAAVLIALILISLLFMMSDWFSSEPELGPVGPPSEGTSLIGFLTVESSQQARVTLDGELLPGHTPLKSKLLPAGSHRLLVKTDSGAVLLDEMVDISAGERKEIRLVVPGGALVEPSAVPVGHADGGLADGANPPSDKKAVTSAKKRRKKRKTIRRTRKKKKKKKKSRRRRRK